MKNVKRNQKKSSSQPGSLSDIKVRNSKMYYVRYLRTNKKWSGAYLNMMCEDYPTAMALSDVAKGHCRKQTEIVPVEMMVAGKK
jgi:hypothetical protein